jgi:capsular polysaccharide transport system permease protein
VPGAALLLAGLNPPSREDTLYLKEFVHSRGAAARAGCRLGLRAHFARRRADWPFVLASDASLEEFVAYYRSAWR